MNEPAYTTASPRLDEIEPESEKRAIFCLWCVEQKVLLWFQFCHFPVTPEVRAKVLDGNDTGAAHTGGTSGL